MSQSRNCVTPHSFGNSVQYFENFTHKLEIHAFVDFCHVFTHFMPPFRFLCKNVETLLLTTFKMSGYKGFAQEGKVRRKQTCCTIPGCSMTSSPQSCVSSGHCRHRCASSRESWVGELQNRNLFRW